MEVPLAEKEPYLLGPRKGKATRQSYTEVPVAGRELYLLRSRKGYATQKFLSLRESPISSVTCRAMREVNFKR